MEFIIDESRSVMVEFTENKYISVIPFTKFQFERFIWETGPKWVDNSYTINRISPQEINKSNVDSVILNNLSFQEAVKISQWMGGRIPGLQEIKSAFNILNDKNLLSNALKFMQQNKNEADARMIATMEWMVKNKFNRLGFTCGDLVTEYPAQPSMIYLQRGLRSTAIVTGNPPTITKDKRFAFSVLMERQ